MKFLSLLIFALFILLAYFLFSIFHRFIKRFLLIRRYKEKVNSLIEDSKNDNSNIP